MKLENEHKANEHEKRKREENEQKQREKKKRVRGERRKLLRVFGDILQRVKAWGFKRKIGFDFKKNEFRGESGNHGEQRNERTERDDDLARGIKALETDEKIAEIRVFAPRHL